jgi:hypothetical protein
MYSTWVCVAIYLPAKLTVTVLPNYDRFGSKAASHIRLNTSI